MVVRLRREQEDKLDGGSSPGARSTTPACVWARFKLVQPHRTMGRRHLVGGMGCRDVGLLHGTSWG